MLNQISVFVENKTGRLASVMKVLNDSNIDIRALTIADTTDFGIIRLVVKDCENALKILKDNGCTANVTKVVAFNVPDRPGGMYSVIDAFENAGINIEYCYSLVTYKEGSASVIVRVADNDKAIEVLNAKGIKLIDDEDII
ncbi:MAG: ACT domain-containing protein [Oscillospiraceae bacterium]